MGLPTFSVNRPVLTGMVFLGFIVFGLISLLRLPIELYQGQSRGIVSIVVRARGGLPALEVEKEITKPVEESVSTVSRLKNLYSHSREAESRVTLEFEPGTNMDFAALEVREKFSRVRPKLPKEIEKPIIANYDDSVSAILIFALTSESLSPEDVREVVDLELKPILNRVNGVASVEVYGGRERKILVELDRDKMVAHNVSIERVMDILGQSNINLLAGDVEKGTLEFAIRTMGAFLDVEEVGEIGIRGSRQGTIIPLKEIATVKDSYMEPADYARLNLDQNVTVYVKKTSLAKTIPVVRDVRQVLDRFEEAKQGKLDIIVVTDKAEAISRAIDDVKWALWIGMFLAVAIIYVFLKQWVLAFIIFLSIPASIIVTFVFMSSFGISINVMTLSGLALAIGILVDSSVVILENMFKKREEGLSEIRSILVGAEEVWQPLLASLLTTIVVFLPVVFIDKQIQMTYSGFAFTVVASLVSSFFVAQMLVPMLMMQWGKNQVRMEAVTSNEHWQKKLNDGYRWLMEKNLRLRYLVSLVVVALFVGAALLISKMDIDTPTSYEENEFAIVIFPLAGAKLDANDDVVKKVEDLLSKIRDVALFSSTVRKEDIKIFVRLKPRRDRTYSKDEIMQLIDEQGNEMIKQTHDDYSLIVDEGAQSSEGKKLIINIFGHENDVLQKIAQEFATQISKTPGLLNLVMTDLRKRPEYALVVDRGRAAYYGISVKDVADSIHAQVRGMRPTKFHELSRGEEIEVITRLQAIYRQKVDDLKLVHIQSESMGMQIPLGEIANFYPSTGPQTIDRKDKYRYVFVKGDAKRPLETLGKEVKAALKNVKLPDDYYWRFGGAYEEMLQGKTELAFALLLTVFLVYMVMACMFQDYVQPLLIMVTVPMASVGIYLGLRLTGKPLSNQVFIGMILLAGYVVNAAIIMIDHLNHLRKTASLGREEILIRCGLDRLRPILMTTASTVLGFLPMAVSWGQASDLWAPLAITVIGGLLSSTLLTLFVVPDFIFITEEIKEKGFKFAGGQIVSAARTLGNLPKLIKRKPLKAEK
ncbi:MAG: efflux RND transporter permease subunit [Candidatus Omnitrophota bacterium]